jgi:hypothetical protein
MQISAGDGLKRFRVSNGQQFVQTDIRGIRDIRQEVEADRKQQKFIKFEQVSIGHQRNVHDEGELQGLGVKYV